MKPTREQLGRWYIGFGIFLITCGVVGFASNPTAAKTALISGGTFGSFCILLGVWMRKGGGRLPYLAAWGVTLLLAGAFSWRASVSWQAVADGQPKLVAAVLISSMLVGALLSIIQLFRVRA